MKMKYARRSMLSLSLPPTNEVLGKVMSLHMCHSVHRGGGGGGGWRLSMDHRSHDQYPGGWLPSMHHRGMEGLHPGGRGVCIQGEGGLPPDWESGRYASYWNASSFVKYLISIDLTKKSESNETVC